MFMMPPSPIPMCCACKHLKMTGPTMTALIDFFNSRSLSLVLGFNPRILNGSATPRRSGVSSRKTRPQDQHGFSTPGSGRRVCRHIVTTQSDSGIRLLTQAAYESVERMPVPKHRCLRGQFEGQASCASALVAAPHPVANLSTHPR